MSWKLEQNYSRLGSGKGEFLYARGLSVSRETGNLLISDIGNKRIQILDSEYKYVNDWEVIVNGSYLCPLDVHRVNENVIAAAIEGHATLWEYPDVTDCADNKIKLLHTFGNKHLVFPRAILSYKDRLLVTDVGKHCISQYDFQGNIIRSIGTLGTDDASNFNWPYYVCRDDKGRIAVSDSHNQCIKLFDENLNYISCFGKDVLTCCAGVAYSSYNGGRFYVGEYDKLSMFEFSSDGRLIECIDNQMPLPPQKLQVDNNNKVMCTTHQGFLVYSK